MATKTFDQLLRRIANRKIVCASPEVMAAIQAIRDEKKKSAK